MTKYTRAGAGVFIFAGCGAVLLGLVCRDGQPSGVIDGVNKNI